MATGKTLELRAFAAKMFWRTVEPRETRERDRSLRGKARVRARKQANRERTAR